MSSLKIKTSSCKRIVKELQSYENEVEREAAKTADMKAKGADPYDLKQQENVLAESRMMVPDCHKRLETALGDLKGTLVELEESGQNEGSEIDDALSTIAQVAMIHEKVLHNHEKCINAQEEAEAVDRQADYVLKEYFTDVAARRALPSSSKKKPEKHFEMDYDEMPDVMEEVLHNHENCLKAWEEAEARKNQVMASYVLKGYFTDVDVADRRALPLSSKKKPENTMKQMPDMLEYFSEDEVLQCRKSELPGKCSLTCRSPRSPPYISGIWDDDEIGF